MQKQLNVTAAAGASKNETIRISAPQTMHITGTMTPHAALLGSWNAIATITSPSGRKWSWQGEAKGGFGSYARPMVIDEQIQVTAADLGVWTVSVVTEQPLAGPSNAKGVLGVQYDDAQSSELSGAPGLAQYMGGGEYVLASNLQLPGGVAVPGWLVPVTVIMGIVGIFAIRRRRR